MCDIIVTSTLVLLHRVKRWREPPPILKWRYSAPLIIIHRETRGLLTYLHTFISTNINNASSSAEGGGQSCHYLACFRENTVCKIEEEEAFDANLYQGLTSNYIFSVCCSQRNVCNYDPNLFVLPKKYKCISVMALTTLKTIII